MCVCICVHVYMYVCVCVYMCVSLGVSMCVCLSCFMVAICEGSLMFVAFYVCGVLCVFCVCVLCHTVVYWLLFLTPLSPSFVLCSE